MQVRNVSRHPPLGAERRLSNHGPLRLSSRYPSGTRPVRPLRAERSTWNMRWHGGQGAKAWAEGAARKSGQTGGIAAPWLRSTQLALGSPPLDSNPVDSFSDRLRSLWHVSAPRACSTWNRPNADATAVASRRQADHRAAAPRLTAKRTPRPTLNGLREPWKRLTRSDHAKSRLRLTHQTTGRHSPPPRRPMWERGLQPTRRTIRALGGVRRLVPRTEDNFRALLNRVHRSG
jgi:hypothetical protein